MARIPEEELERIKRETDLAALVRRRGIELHPHGTNLIGLCPFHDDHEPSLVITPARNLWHCLGACSRGGSVIDWVMRIEGVSFRHAVELLRHGGPPSSPGEVLVKESTIRRLPSPVVFDAADHELLLQVVDYYHTTLKRSPEALTYLSQRGIGSPDAITTFRLGFGNRTLGLRLPDRARADGARIRQRLSRLGIIRTSGHEAFNGCVTFPVLDDDGHVTEMYGRKINDRLREGTLFHLYLPGPHHGVWNLPALRSYGEVILCEALIDALSFWCAGFLNVTSSYGVNGFTPDHLAAFKAHGTERVLIAYDRDEAGDRAAAELASRLAGEGITSFRVLFPHGMDANEYACKVTPASQSLAVLLRSAEHMAGPLVFRPAVVPARLGDPATPAPCEPPGAVAETCPDRFSSPAPPQPSFLAAVLEGSAADPADPAAAAAGIDGSDLVEAPSPEPAGPEPTPAAAAPPSPSASRRPPPATGLLSPPTTAPCPEPPAPCPASPIPPEPRPPTPAECSEHQVLVHLGDRTWRVRGLAKNLSFETMRVNLLVGLDGDPARFHQDTLDLYSAKQRQAFTRAAATELGCKEDLVKRDLGAVLLKLEELQELAIRKALEPKQAAVVVTEADRAAALELLRDPKLLSRILTDFERCGVVGESTNKLVGYLATVTRKLDEPLAIIIQSSTAAGKTALMKAILAFVPEEERVHYSAMTGQSLFYMAETDLRHKILAIAEEEGAERAGYALKLLQSEGELSIASTGKDPATGRLVTHEYEVKGPVMIFLTTTAIDLDEELRNRCLVLTVDEDREQTRAIHRLQRERRTLEGIFARREKTDVLALHRNAQRLLKPLPVANPYARRLTFLDSQTRTRRDHEKYLTLIEAVALLHQHQREHKTAWRDGRQEHYIEVTLADIATANRLAHEVLGRTLDELPPQTRRFLVLLDGMVSEACRRARVERTEHRFTRWDIRHALGWSYDQVRVHLERLVELEYVLVHRGSRGQSFVYELLWDGKGTDGQPFLIGLLDVDHLRAAASATPTAPTLGGGASEIGGPLGGHPAPVGVRLGPGGDTRKPRRHLASLGPAAEEAGSSLLPGLSPAPDRTASRTEQPVAPAADSHAQAAAEPEGQQEPQDELPLLAAAAPGRRRP